MRVPEELGAGDAHRRAPVEWEKDGAHGAVSGLRSSSIDLESIRLRESTASDRPESTGFVADRLG